MGKILNSESMTKKVIRNFVVSKVKKILGKSSNWENFPGSLEKVPEIGGSETGRNT